MKELLKQLIQGKNLTQAQVEAGMKMIMNGEICFVQIAAFITAMRMKIGKFEQTFCPEGEERLWS